MEQTPNKIPTAPWIENLFTNKCLSWIWLIVRVYVGYEWIVAGWGKIMGGAWVGANAGGPLQGFLTGALAKTAGAHPDVAGWYAYFVSHVVMPHVFFFSHMVAIGEVLVGAALILGIFTGIAAFFGGFMSFNFMLAGTVSINPVLFLLEVLLMLAWRTAGYIGLDKWALPLLGTPWQHGSWCKGGCCGKTCADGTCCDTTKTDTPK